MTRRLPASLLAAVALTLVAVGCGGDDESSDAAAAAAASGGEPIGPADEGIEGVEAFRVASNDHTQERLAYDPTPPVGGDHHPVPVTCGFYTDEQPVEMLVHSLEHGAVWVAYAPDLGADDADVLRSLVRDEAKVVATPLADLGAPVVVSAWGRQLRLDSVDDARMGAFVEQYRAGDRAPEPQVPCEGQGDPDVVAPA